MASEEANPNMASTEETVENEGQHELSGDNKDATDQLPNAPEHLEPEEGESSSTSVANIITDIVQSNAMNTDQTEAQSTTLPLPLPEKLLEACGGISSPQVSQQSGTSVSNPTSPGVASAQYVVSQEVAAQVEAFRTPNIEPDMVNLLPPNQPDASSQILFPSQAALETLVCEDNAHNISQQPSNTYENSCWHLNNYQFPISNLPPDFSLAAATPSIQLSTSQASGYSLYSPSFLRTQWTDWYSQNKIKMQEPLSTPVGSQELQFQGLLNQGLSSSFFSSGGGSHPARMPFQQARVNMQDGMLSSSNLHPSSTWISQGHNFSNISTTPSSRPTSQSINAVYDPTYEAMGLPVDPHLRMFLARLDAAAGDEM